MKIALVGWNCRKNIGDDIMTDVIISQISKKYDKCTFTIIGDSKNLPIFKSLGNGNKVRGFRGLDFFNSLPMVRTIYHWLYIAFYVSLFSDLIIIGGGSIYHSVQLSRYYRFLHRLTSFFNSSCKIDSLGVSVGPFKTQDEALEFKELQNSLSSISVRDERSYNLVSKLWNGTDKVQRYPDVALSYNILFPIQERRERTVGIVLRQGHVTNEIARFLEALIKEVSINKSEYKFVFYSFCEYHVESQNDYFAICDFFKTSKLDIGNFQILRYNNDPHAFCRELAKASMIVTMRLHGGIMAYALNVPFFMISYHKKCEDFIDELEIDRKYLIDTKDSVSENVAKVCLEIEEPRQQNNEYLLTSSLAHFSQL